MLLYLIKKLTKWLLYWNLNIQILQTKVQNLNMHIGQII